MGWGCSDGRMVEGKGILGTSRRPEKKWYDNFNPGFFFNLESDEREEGWYIFYNQIIQYVFMFWFHGFHVKCFFDWYLQTNLKTSSHLETINTLRFGMPAAAPLRGMFRCFRLENPEVRICCWRILVPFRGGFCTSIHFMETNAAGRLLSDFGRMKFDWMMHEFDTSKVDLGGAWWFKIFKN